MGIETALPLKKVVMAGLCGPPMDAFSVGAGLPWVARTSRAMTVWGKEEMKIDRRSFLAGLSAFGFVSTAASALPTAPRLISAAKLGTRDGGAVWSESGLVPFALPMRGHAPVRLPDGRVLVMGRRPGLLAAIVDPRDPAALTSFTAGDSRFAGHAAVSPDGAALVTSQFDATTFEAALALRDPKTGAERGSWKPGGIEPHELVFARDRLIVALGGLIKDGGVAGPAFNPGGIDSAVLEIDPKSRRVLARHKLKDPSLSLRHLGLHGDSVVVAAQDQDLTETRPLLAAVAKELEPFEWPDPRDCDFRGYIGSVAIDRSGAFVAAASPRGSVLGLWSAASGKWLGGLPIADVCGVAADDKGFWASSGMGEIVRIAASDKGPIAEARWHVDAGFDNHLLALI
jgi:hypothetical protein